MSKSLAKKKVKLSDLRSRVSRKGGGRMAMNDYIDSQKELTTLKQQVADSKASFEGAGQAVDDDILELEQTLVAVQADVAEQGERFKAQEFVALTVTNAIDTGNLNTVQSFGRYIAYNYAGDQPVANGAYEIKGDQMNVRNSGEEAGRLSEVLEKFADNDGSAVQFGGRQLDLDVNAIPALGNWFTNTAANGANFAVLDEAQYQTLALAEVDAAGKPSAADGSDLKDVIVGTANDVGGKTLTLARAEAAGNGIVVDGGEIFLGHDEYYAVAGEDGITVIKGGAVHNWQEKATDVELDVDIPYRMVIPETGMQMSFEKTLLSAGESADIELTFEG